MMNAELGIGGEAQQRIAILTMSNLLFPHSTFCIPN